MATEVLSTYMYSVSNKFTVSGQYTQLAKNIRVHSLEDLGGYDISPFIA